MIGPRAGGGRIDSARRRLGSLAVLEPGSAIVFISSAASLRAATGILDGGATSFG